MEAAASSAVICSIRPRIELVVNLCMLSLQQIMRPFGGPFLSWGGGGVSSEPREPPLATALSKFHEYMHGAQSVASFLKTPHRRRKHGGNGGNCPRTLATTGAVPPYKIQL